MRSSGRRHLEGTGRVTESFGGRVRPRSPGPPIFCTKMPIQRGDSLEAPVTYVLRWRIMFLSKLQGCHKTRRSQRRMEGPGMARSMAIFHACLSALVFPRVCHLLLNSRSRAGVQAQLQAMLAPESTMSVKHGYRAGIQGNPWADSNRDRQMANLCGHMTSLANERGKRNV